MVARREWTKEDSERMDAFAAEAVEVLTKIISDLLKEEKLDHVSGMLTLMAFHNRWCKTAGHKRLNEAYRDIFIPAFRRFITDGEQQDKDQLDA